MTTAVAGCASSLWKLYCEGYHDRDFLAGLFEHALGARSLKGDPSFKKGVFGYELGSQRVEIHASGGKKGASDGFEAQLKQAGAVRPAGLVICLDEDDACDVDDARRRARERILRMAERLPGFDPETLRLRTSADHEVALVPVTWCCADPSDPVLPQRQNLERLMVAALCEAHPERGPAVATWLAARPRPPDDDASRSKSFSWSHMAGWFPSPGGNRFFGAVWSDDIEVRAALIKRMAATGVDALLTAMGVTPPWSR